MDGKIKLTKGRDYITTALKEEIQEVTGLRPFVVLTPYKSRCSSSSNTVVATPRHLLDNPCGDVSHVFVEDIELMEDFGYMEDLQRLRSMGTSFVLLNTRTAPGFIADPVLLCMNRYFVELQGDDRYVALFILCKIYGDVTVVCRDVKRVRMFSDIFKLNSTVVSHTETIEREKILVVMDHAVDAECERLFYIGVACDNARKISLGLDKAGKYLSRIRDVCVALTHAVVSGKRQLNMNRFCNIDK